jgi:hypothetical protein
MDKQGAQQVASVPGLDPVFRTLFIPKNPDKKHRIYELIGIGLLRKAIAGTIGRIAPASCATYHMPRTEGNSLDGLAEFACKGTVINEVSHWLGGLVMLDVPFISGKYLLAAESVNLSLILVQRYNRIRMLKKISEGLENDTSFTKGYTNWAKLDGATLQ